MGSLSQKEFSDDVAAALRRAEAGEELTITASGRPVASLGPPRSRGWVPSSLLAELWRAPADPTLEADLEKMSDIAIRDV